VSVLPPLAEQCNCDLERGVGAAASLLHNAIATLTLWQVHSHPAQHDILRVVSEHMHVVSELSASQPLSSQTESGRLTLFFAAETPLLSPEIIPNHSSTAFRAFFDKQAFAARRDTYQNRTYR